MDCAKLVPARKGNILLLEAQLRYALYDDPLYFKDGGRPGSGRLLCWL